MHTRGVFIQTPSQKWAIFGPKTTLCATITRTNSSLNLNDHVVLNLCAGRGCFHRILASNRFAETRPWRLCRHSKISQFHALWEKVPLLQNVQGSFSPNLGIWPQCRRCSPTGTGRKSRAREANRVTIGLFRTKMANCPCGILAFFTAIFRQNFAIPKMTAFYK